MISDLKESKCVQIKESTNNEDGEIQQQTDATLSPWKPGFHCESNIAVAVMYSAAAAHRNP
eukprot:CAMPEP_0194447532 /NCGR_PEP_ID=MMETSP0176-20130528/129059_1 /TAXON_ID=216777 /ORGANISM="Proboscia alata, Strain PI-D3" /LENGTH=60 /DNA_ID=CAMNT_0039274393 /DNA_START=287 /DNA_END=469 /DNA_ORIENTATION=+